MTRRRPLGPNIAPAAMVYARGLGIAVCLCALLFAGLLAGAQPQTARRTLSAEDYARAERALGWNSKKLTLNLEIEPRWLDDGSRFWYLHQSSQGQEMVAVDVTSGRQGPAFDHAKVATALSAATHRSFTPGTLPLASLVFREGANEIAFSLESKEWVCSLNTYACRADGTALEEDPGYALSPDREKGIFIHGDNLWMLQVSSGKATQLTGDGEPHNSYGVEPGATTTAVTNKIRYPIRPLVYGIWSADSSKFLTYKLDESKMKDSYLIQSVPPGPAGRQRPILHAFRFPYPGDTEVAAARYAIFDPAAHTSVKLDLPVEDVTDDAALTEGNLWWSKDGKSVYCIWRDRWAQEFKFFGVDAATGKARLLLEERMKTDMQLNPGYAADGPLVRVLENGRKAIWFSERDGWGHLYLYDTDGKSPATQITHGDWMVRGLEYVDENTGTVYFTAGGKETGEDPYLKHLYRIQLDGTGLRLLTPEDADHRIRFSPSGKYFVDTYSRADTVPKSVLRDTQGKVVMDICTADISKLLATGWKFPEPYHAKAADGATDIYGAIYRPSNFDPNIHYPIVDSIYPGPQHIRTRKTLTDVLNDNAVPQSLAELGFIVVTVEGRGTPLRSRDFHDYSYNRMGVAGGLEDHIAAIRQLARRYSYLDLSRVGIYGHSAGGFATARAMLAYPDFYKVGVSSAGNHDQRGNIAIWGEQWKGKAPLADYDEASNPVLALKSPLKGKMLIAWGDMDDNVNPSLSIQLIDSLIKTNSDFDTLVLPNCNHRLSALNPYFLRRRWDYFVRNLQGNEPPAGYAITTVPGDYRPLEPMQVDDASTGTN